MNINHISVSRKKCFDECQQKYKFRYHLKTPSPIPEPFYFVYGTIVHKIAELYVERKGEIPIDAIAKDIRERKIPIESFTKLDENGKAFEEHTYCPDLPADYEKKFPKHIKALKKLNEKIGPIGETEYEFKLDLDPPNKKIALGFIDRLIILGEGDERRAFIIDYKTTKKSKWRVNAQTVVHDLQLRCYARVVQKNFGIPPKNIQAALYYLEGEELVAAQFSESSLIRVEEELRRGFIQIENSDPDKVWGNVSWQCKNCEYASLCPFYSNQNKPVWEDNVVQIDNQW